MIRIASPKPSSEHWQKLKTDSGPIIAQLRAEL